MTFPSMHACKAASRPTEHGIRIFRGNSIKLVPQWAAAEETCRATPPVTAATLAACGTRDALTHRIQALGYTYCEGANPGCPWHNARATTKRN
jgi:hypothetical protein